MTPGRSIFWLAASMLAFLPAIAGASVADGIDAYNRGDYAAALSEFRKAAVRDDTDAQNYLGVMYAQGLGVARDDRVAADWFFKAAVLGYPEAQVDLAYMYAEGRGVQQDNKAAVSNYRAAAIAGFQPAMTRMAEIYEKGELGEAPDAALAREWRTKAQDSAKQLANTRAVPIAPVPAAKVEPKVKPVVRAAPSGDKRYLQLGAFASRDNAEKLRAAALRELGVPQDFVQIVEGSGLIRVQVGPCANRDEALRLLRKIKSTLGISALVVRTDGPNKTATPKLAD